jgi:hypothetical protein
MIDSVENTAKSLGLNKKQIATDVEAFLAVQGEGACLHALNIMGKYQRREADKGLYAGTAIRAWRWASSLLVANKDREVRFDAQRQEREEMEQAYYDTKEKGYHPDKETLLAQLEDQYDRGVISIQDYSWGMKGLQVVHGYVEAAQELDDVPF